MNMKTKITTLALMLAALGGFAVNTTAAAAPEKGEARVHRVNRVELRGSPTIQVGSSLFLVRDAIGSADEKLTRDLWLYYNFQPIRRGIGRDECSRLIIHFVNNRVASMHLANARARAVMAARIDRGGNELVALRTVPAAPTGTQVAGK
jgi:hypothetical protein